MLQKALVTDPIEFTGGCTTISDEIYAFSKLEIEPLNGTGDNKEWPFGLVRKVEAKIERKSGTQ